MLMMDDGKHLEVVEAIGLDDTKAARVVNVEGTISGWVASHVQPLLVTDISQQPGIQSMGHDAGGSFISVPLEHKTREGEATTITESSMQKVLAVLNVSGKRGGGTFTESDLKTLSIVANHAAAALENVRLIREIEEGRREILFTLGEIVETRSRETGFHVKRVAEYCKLLGSKLGLSAAESEILRLAAPLHDVGKVGIPDAVLNKPGKLTPEEFDVIKTHSQLGYDMLKVAKDRVLQSAAVIALQHHEKWNGKGYPRGLRGKEIHIYGRITGLADVFDALGVERVYKPAWPLEKILALFREERGEHFDPEITDCFFDHLKEVLEIRDAFPEQAAGAA
jgi:response regulator RpfG family c-di-GMP phosphodiesterase